MNVQKLLVKNILLQATAYKWSLQGLGMLRLYLSDSVRLHVWNKTFAFKGASPIHTHPWDFKSTVVAGSLQNVIYLPANGGALYNRARLKCGPGGHLEETAADKIILRAMPPWIYTEGEFYLEEAEVIHESIPEDGTVTIVERSFKEDKDHAFVYWPQGTEWGTAEPREATMHEVLRITRHALETWFKG